MDLLGPTLVLYVVIGAGVAGAVYVSERSSSALLRAGNGMGWGLLVFHLITAVLFWPLYLPMLLSSTTIRADTPAVAQTASQDEMDAAILQVDAELEAALTSLDGWAEDVLAREKDRIHELHTAWTAQAQRIREMDRLLALPEFSIPALELPGRAAFPLLEDPESARGGNCDRRRHSSLALRQNKERLGQVRHRAYEDLMGTLAWVRELASMIHLAKFTGAPASRAGELVAQIAAAVEGLSDLTWRDDPLVHVADDTSIRG